MVLLCKWLMYKKEIMIMNRWWGSFTRIVILQRQKWSLPSSLHPMLETPLIQYSIWTGNRRQEMENTTKAILKLLVLTNNTWFQLTRNIFFVRICNNITLLKIMCKKHQILKYHQLWYQLNQDTQSSVTTSSQLQYNLIILWIQFATSSWDGEMVVFIVMLKLIIHSIHLL